MNGEWRKRGGKEMDLRCSGEVVREQICIRRGNRRGMRFFIRTHLREQVEKRKEKIKDAAIEKVREYIRISFSFQLSEATGQQLASVNHFP